MPKSKIHLFVCVVLLFLGSHGAIAQAQEVSTQDLMEAQEVERLSAEGVTAYKAKNYTQAVSLFKQALAIQPVSNLLYNIARACELMGDDRKAAHYYTKFIRSPDVAETAREKARTRIRDVEVRLAALGPASSPDTNSGRNPGGSRSVVLGGAEQGGDNGLSSVVGWVSLSGGLVALVTSSVLAARVGEEMDSFSSAVDLEQKRGYQSNAEAFTLAADIGFGVGTMLLGTGITLVVLDWMDSRKSEASTQSHFHPVVGPGELGVVGAWSF